MFYATRQSTDGAIAEHARIITFASQSAAESWLLAGHTTGLHPRVTVGHFLGTWRITAALGSEVIATCAPFRAEQLKTTRPEDGPGNYYSHVPTEDVLVMVDSASN